MSAKDLLPPLSLFPSRHRCVARFAEVATFTAPNTNLCGCTVYALNGLNFCNITNSRGNPYGWTQASAIWNQYCVLRARFVVTVEDTSGDGVQIGVQLRGPSVTGANPTTPAQRPGAYFSTISNTGEQRAILRGDISMPEAFGRSMDVIRANFGSAVSANPGAGASDYTCFLQLWYASIQTGGLAVTFQATVAIEFDVEFFDQVSY